MTSEPFWEDDEQSGLWDVLIFDGRVLPGLALVTAGDGTGRKLDARSAPGSDGGNTVDKGLDLTKFEVTLRMWLQEQYDAWKEVIGDLNARRVQRRGGGAYTIYHPALQLNELDRALVEKVGILTPGSPKGVWEVKVKFIEHRPPTRTNVTRRVVPGVLQASTGAASTIITSTPPSANNTGPS